jgi:hypothetical protein
LLPYFKNYLRIKQFLESDNMEQNKQELVALWKDQLTTDEEKIFLRNFQDYLVNEINEHSIDLDSVLEWVGFARKDHAKRLLEKHFTNGDHYIVKNKTENVNIRFINDDASQGRGGHNKEIILLTPDTFKAYCLLAQTERGKATREYYIKMERIMMRYMKTKLIESSKKQEEIIKENEKMRKELEKGKHSKELAGYIYIGCDLRDNRKDIYKVGETMESRKRLSSMNTTHADDTFVFYRQFETKHRRLAEKLIHEYLDTHNYRYDKEFFNIDASALIKIITCCVTFVNELYDEKSNMSIEERVETLEKKMKSTAVTKEEVAEIVREQTEIVREEIENIPLPPTSPPTTTNITNATTNDSSTTINDSHDTNNITINLNIRPEDLQFLDIETYKAFIMEKLSAVNGVKTLTKVVLETLDKFLADKQITPRKHIRGGSKTSYFYNNKFKEEVIKVIEDAFTMNQKKFKHGEPTGRGFEGVQVKND